MSWPEADPASLWPAPDLSVIQSGERPPPELPLEVFGPAWADWITAAADASACPVDYVAAPLLASVSVLVGNARWAKATSTWVEPPHLWVGVVGHSGAGKSPGADPLLRDVLPEIERRMALGFADKLEDWQRAFEYRKAEEEAWKSAVREAKKKATDLPPPLDPSAIDITMPPQQPRLWQSDVTIEKIAAILATAAPKGVLITRDELMGWVAGMTAYNPAGREFWLEAYGGRCFKVERQKLNSPIVIEHHAVGVFGGTQPSKLALLMRGVDDGLMARFLWWWPNPVEFRIGRATPKTEWAIEALDKLRELDLFREHDRPGRPIMLPLAYEAMPILEKLGREMQHRQGWADGLLSSAYGKARGQVLRLSLNLEHLWWCSAPGFDGPPTTISESAVTAAAGLVDSYFMPMAERVYGDAAMPEGERLTTTLARWIWRQKPTPELINAREVQRLKLSGLREAGKVGLAIDGLVGANWLCALAGNSTPGRPRADYAVNPRLSKAKTDE